MIDTYFRRIGLPCYFIGIVGLFVVSEPIDNADENNGEPMMWINTRHVTPHLTPRIPHIYRRADDADEYRRAGGDRGGPHPLHAVVVSDGGCL